MDTKVFLDHIIDELARSHGEAHREDIRRGVYACHRVFSGTDRDLHRFCREQYVPPGEAREALLRRIDRYHQAVAGGLQKMLKVVREGSDIADHPFSPAEGILGAFTPDSHLTEDYRRFNIAALVQLNFGTDDTTPPETRSGWAARRIGEIGRETIPAELLQRLSERALEVDRFVNGYNLHLDRIDFGDPRIRFPENTRLISHWGLRDYLVSLYGTPDALPRQRAILDLLRRVVDGEIPTEILDNPDARWDMTRGTVTVGGETKPARFHGPLRWEKFKAVFDVQREIDPYTRYGNMIDNAFLRDREIPEEEVVALLESILTHPLRRKVADWIERRLGRKLEPFDIYFADFEHGGGKTPLGYDLGRRYPDAKALQAAIPGILTRFGWSPERAAFIAGRIRVDNARSAGHAWPPHTDDDLQLLRVRIDPGGITELDFSTFMHELGHCVEGVLSSYELDWKALWSVPTPAFTEGFAFTFQNRTDEILGRTPQSHREATALHEFWKTYEIGGVAMMEIRLFHWLYEYPDADAEAIHRAARKIADEVWGEYFAEIFGEESWGLPGVYSHILWCTFYLPEYPLGHIIAYQIRK
ncbi:MAG: hypothetical protein D6795_09655, partial [Deltaproteobacteria bacterium]